MTGLDGTIHHRLDLLETQLTDVTARLACLRRRSRQALGSARAALVLGSGLLLTAATPAGTAVTVPFRVDDGNNRPIVTVTETPNHAIIVYDARGTAVIGLASLGQTSFFKVHSSDMQSQVVIGQNAGAFPAVYLRTGGDENNLLSLAVLNHIPALNMGHGMVNMTQATGGGGLVQLGDESGQEKVGFVVGPDGVGIARAQPVGNAGVNVPRTGIFRGTGLPSTLICGIGCINP